jgi:ABC-2 type transport system ATP-binding protein
VNAIEIKNLTKIFPGGKKAVDDVTLAIKEGEFFALLGPNGAGKTTTINILTGLVLKTDGDVRVFGESISDNHTYIKSLIGVVPQEFNFGVFESLIDIVVTQAGFYGVKRKDALVRAEEVLKRLSLWEKRNDQARTLSGGMKRRLMIARALMHDPKILILDEPTAGVDVELRREMWVFLQDLNKKGMTILLTTHYLEEAEQLCKQMAVIQNGKVIAQGAIKDLISNQETQVFVVDTATIVSEDAVKKMDGFYPKRTDDNALEIVIDAKHTLASFFDIAKEFAITVTSIRPKSNRLEEFFITLTQK